MTIVWEIGASLFDCFLATHFIIKFNSRKWKECKLAIPTLLILLAFTLFSDKFLSGFNLLSTIILIILASAFSIIISNRHYVRAIVASCSFYTLLILISSFLFTIFSFFVDDLEILMQGENSPSRFLMVAMHKVLLFAILQFILHIFKINNRMNLFNAILIFAFSSITVVGLGLTMHLALTQNSDKINIQISSITIAFVLSNILFYIMIAQIDRLQRHKYELKLLEEKMQFEKKRYDEANIIWDNIKHIRHDMKQHFSVVLGQIQSGDINECQKYISNLLPEIESMGNIVKTDNSVVNYILNSKLSTIKNVDIVISGIVKDFNDIESRDLACIIGNILDNAIEALNKIADSHPKRLELIFANQNSSRIILCKNSIEKSVLKTNKNLVSTKPHSDSHGFGHKIVEKIVRNYCGTVNYFEEDGMFGVQIIIPPTNQ